jgi:esterase/lipase superfamily enzyme
MGRIGPESEARVLTGLVKRTAVLLLIALSLAGCAEKPALVPYGGAVAKTQPIMVATSRNVVEGTPLTFGGLRSQQVHFAQYQISIPPERTAGNLRLPQGAPDPATDFLATGYQNLDDQTAFIASINRMLDPLPAQDRQVTLFVHGYNTGFAASVLNTAQVAEDYRIKGPSVLFSWPSAERVTHYVYDRDSTLFARDQFVETLQALAKTKASSIVIMAHSMGSFLTMEGVSRLRDRGDRKTLERISAIVLSEPDIDLDVFRTQVRGIDLRRLGLVVVTSGRDRILRVSSFVAGGHPRLGEPKNRETLRQLGVIVVDVSHFDDGTLGGHSAFQRSPELVRLIGSGELARALESGGEGENIVVGALSAVGTVALAVAYLPYELIQQ